MTKYSLKTYYGTKLIEVFEKRTIKKLLSILSQSRFQTDGLDPFGNKIEHANTFEIYNLERIRIFRGNLPATINMIKSL